MWLCAERAIQIFGAPCINCEKFNPSGKPITGSFCDICNEQTRPVKGLRNEAQSEGPETQEESKED
jgi:hypothetical protein